MPPQPCPPAAASSSSQPRTPAAASRRPRPECPFEVHETLELPLGRVNYLYIGPPAVAQAGAPPLIICVHGFSGNLSTFETVAPELCSRGFRVLCYDLYGVGMSAAPKRRLDLDLYIEQLEAMAAAVGAKPGGEQIGLLGFSMGGIICVEFARRFPARVAKLLLVSPAGLLQHDLTPCAFCVFNCIRTRFCGECLVASASCLARHFVCGSCAKRAISKRELFNLDVPEPERFPQYEAYNQKMSQRFMWDFRKSVTSYLKTLRHIPMWEDAFRAAYAEVAAGPVEVLFMWGDADTTIPWEEEQEAITALFGPRGASCIFFSEYGHALLIENGATVAHCASYWFSNSQEPAWIKCLKDFALPNPETVGECSI